VIIAAFKEYAVFGNGGDARHLTATVKDKGLASQIGNSLSLNFDAGSWHIVNSCAEQVRTYLALGNQSLLISFRHGKGQVIFTSFHNHAQVSKIEERLLQFLVLKPVLADVAAELGDFAWSDTKELQENVGTVNSGGESEWFEYRLPTSRPFKIMLNWKGEANLALEVNGPGASITEQSDHPPVAVDFPEALAGIWRYRIKALSATIKNFPFVLLAGTPARVDEMSAPLLPAELIQRLAANQPIQVDPEILHQIKLLNEKDNEQDLDIKFIEE
jgi:VanZ family protein